MPDLWMQRRMWFRAAIVFCILAVPVLTVVNGYLWTQRSKDENHVTLLQQQVNAEAKYILGQQTAAQLAAKVAKQAAQARCRQQIQGTAALNSLLEKLHDAFAGIAEVSVNPKVVPVLHAAEKALHPYPVPQCDSGPKPKKTKGADG